MAWTIERRENVAVVAMNTNKANAQNAEFFSHLRSCFDELEAEFADCGIVLTGMGKAFSAGLDVEYAFPIFAHGSADEVAGWIQAYRALLLRVFTYPKPTVAAINGHAFAGGLLLALCCDVRIAADDGLQFGLNEALIGIPMSPALVEVVKYSIGAREAKRMIQSGGTLNQADALRIGVIDQTAPREGLVDEAVRLAARIPKDCHVAYASSKRALQAPAISSIEAGQYSGALDWARAVCHPDSLAAQTQAYRSLKGRDPSWLTQFAAKA